MAHDRLITASNFITQQTAACTCEQMLPCVANSMVACYEIFHHFCEISQLCTLCR